MNSPENSAVIASFLDNTSARYLHFQVFPGYSPGRDDTVRTTKLKDAMINRNESDLDPGSTNSLSNTLPIELTERFSKQDNFLTTYDFKSPSTTYAFKSQNMTYASKIPNMTYASKISNMTYASKIPNMTYAFKSQNTTYAFKNPNMTFAFKAKTYPMTSKAQKSGRGHS